MTPQQFIASLFVLLAMMTGAPRAHAVTIGKGAGQAIEKTGANTASAVVKSGGTSSTFADLLAKPSALSRDGEGALLVSDLLKMPFKPQDIGTVTNRITAANLARGVMGLGTAYLAGEALEALGKQACVRLMGGTWQMNPAGTWEECVPGTGATAGDLTDARTYWARVVNGQIAAKSYVSNGEACATLAAGRPYSIGGSGQSCAIEGGDGGTLLIGSECPPKTQADGNGRCSYTETVETEWREIPQGSAQSKLENAIKAASNSQRVIQAVRDMLEKGGTVEADSPTITGPATGQPTTTTGTQQITTRNPDGSTSTSTVNITNSTVNHYTYNGGQVTARSVSTTTKTDDKGNTTEETTESEPEEPPTDTPMPPIPNLYERKYPDGMLGIWRDQSDQLKQSGLFQLAQQLMPQVPDGGQCPSFKVPLNYASWADFGEGDVSPPCWIWDFGKVVILISAGLLARRLIFGG